MKKKPALSTLPDEDLATLLRHGIILEPAGELFRRHHAAVESEATQVCGNNRHAVTNGTLNAWVSFITHPEIADTVLSTLLLSTRKTCLHTVEDNADATTLTAHNTAEPDDIEIVFLTHLQAQSSSMASVRETVLKRIADGQSPTEVLQSDLHIASADWLVHLAHKETESTENSTAPNKPRGVWQGLAFVLVGVILGSAATRLYFLYQPPKAAKVFVDIFRETLDEPDWPVFTTRQPNRSAPPQMPLNTMQLSSDLSLRVSLHDKPSDVIDKLPDRPAGLVWQVFSPHPEAHEVRAWVAGLRKAMKPSHKPEHIEILSDTSLPDDALRIVAPITP